MRDPVALEIRRSLARIEAAERRLARTVLSGKVRYVDPDKRRLRLKLGVNSRGEDVLSPWIRWQEAGVGVFSIHSQPAIDEQMMMVSASGTIGDGSIAMPATYDQDHAAPSKASDMTVMARDDARIELKGKAIHLIGDVKMRGDSVTHNEVEIGENHNHTDTMPGGGLSGPPQK